MSTQWSRRSFLAATTGLAGAGSLPGRAAEPQHEFRFSLNTSTIQWKLALPEAIDIVAAVGYHGIEPWVRELDVFTKSGGSLKDLGKRARDRGLAIIDVIGFAEWIVDDEGRRRKGLDEAKRVMAMCQEIGCPNMAAPPVGATEKVTVDLMLAADRYAALCKVGESMAVTPMVEHWGHSKNVRRLGEAVLIAMESSVRGACVLPDVFHLYKGGSEFTGLNLLGKAAFPILHMNDYPNHDRATIKDAQRVYPGDGVAPLKQLIGELRAIDFRGMLSLELFNPEYWKRDPKQVIKIGLEKMRAQVNP